MLLSLFSDFIIVFITIIISVFAVFQGYRVEYVAAADALTYAPESFHEFFNQRRRWGPSTMANILGEFITRTWKFSSACLYIYNTREKQWLIATHRLPTLWGKP